MKKHTPWILAVLALGVIVIGFYGVNVEKRSRKADISAENAKASAAAEERFKKWAYVAKEKAVSPTETVKLLIIPDSSGFAQMDTKCIIYTNHEFRSSTMLCPGADRVGVFDQEE